VGCILAVNDPAFGTVAGFGDVTLRAKLLLEQSPGQPALGVRFSVNLPETPEDEGLGPNTLRMSVQMLLTQGFGATSLDLNAGLAVQDVPLQGSVQSDFLAYGVAVRHRFGPRLEGGIEVAGLLGHGEPGADQRGEVRIGLRYGSGQTLWTAALRRGLMESDGTWGGTLGFTWTPRPGKTPSQDAPADAPAAP